MAIDAHSRDVDAVKHALAAGQTTVVDPSTGHWRSLYANCPHDGQRASIRRLVRGEHGAITGLTMRCPACGRDFDASVESLYLE